MSYSKAIVIGGGMGGLVTAAVLSRHFDSVRIIDRDAIPDTPMPRNGAPQSHHFHGLLPGGLEIMNELLAGFEKDLEANGSLVPEPHQVYSYTPEGKSYSQLRFAPEPVSLPPDWPRGHIQTRGLLEHCLRKRVEALPNVQVSYETMVREPVMDGQRVVGVKVDGGEEIGANLVVDASGRVSRALGWLAELGYEKPAVSEVCCDFAYSSIMVTPADANEFTDVCYFMRNDPASEHPLRGGALVRTEEGALLAMVGGRLGDHPPKDYDGFMDYARTMIEPSFAKILERGTLIGEPHHFKFPKSVWRHYEKLESFPDGLLPLGDAVSHFNPVYGQGMSSAARQAQALGKLLTARKTSGESLEGLWKSFFPAAAEQIRAPWLFAALADFSQPGTTGDFPHHEQPVIDTMGKLMAQSNKNDPVAIGMLGMVQAMRQPLAYLQGPEVLAQVAGA